MEKLQNIKLSNRNSIFRILLFCVLNIPTAGLLYAFQEFTPKVQTEWYSKPTSTASRSTIKYFSKSTSSIRENQIVNIVLILNYFELQQNMLLRQSKQHFVPYPGTKFSFPQSFSSDKSEEHLS
jgi:hypothetical protein